jgi:hypothetical protein
MMPTRSAGRRCGNELICSVTASSPGASGSTCEQEGLQRVDGLENTAGAGDASVTVRSAPGESEV